MLGLVCGVHQAGDAGLHLKGHLILGDTGGDFRIIHSMVEAGIEAVDGAYEIALLLARDAGWVGEIKDRIAAAAELDTLKAARQKTWRPLAGGYWLRRAAGAMGDQHDETRQIGRVTAQTVSHPRTHRGPADDLGAGIPEHVRRV